MKKRSHKRHRPERAPLFSRLFSSKDERKARMKERHYTSLETTVNLQPYGNIVKRSQEEQPPPSEPIVQDTPAKPRVQKLTIWQPW